MDDLCDLTLTLIRLRVKPVIPPSCRHQRDLFIQVSCERLSCRFTNETKRDVAVGAWLRPASGFCFSAAARWGFSRRFQWPHSPKENKEIRVSHSHDFFFQYSSHVCGETVNISILRVVDEIRHYKDPITMLHF